MVQVLKLRHTVVFEQGVEMIVAVTEDSSSSEIRGLRPLNRRETHPSLY